MTKRFKNVKVVMTINIKDVKLPVVKDKKCGCDRTFSGMNERMLDNILKALSKEKTPGMVMRVEVVTTADGEFRGNIIWA